ncbi:hypothetical protein GQ53DRAFT_184436 [Thozetella sp. PMI_491]|nr:hypothetical protein GQ53DRAFT_184436 [Thozetella sp. PMI_491]
MPLHRCRLGKTRQERVGLLSYVARGGSRRLAASQSTDTLPRSSSTKGVSAGRKDWRDARIERAESINKLKGLVFPCRASRPVPPDPPFYSSLSRPQSIFIGIESFAIADYSSINQLPSVCAQLHLLARARGATMRLDHQLPKTLPGVMKAAKAKTNSLSLYLNKLSRRLAQREGLSYMFRKPTRGSMLSGKS